MKLPAAAMAFGIITCLSLTLLGGLNYAQASPQNPDCTHIPGMSLIVNPAVYHPGRPGCTNNPTFSRPNSGDPQYGYSTPASHYAYGISDTQTAVQALLTASPNVGIGEAFTDDITNSSAGIWYHIGIGNNINDGSVMSGCSSAPVIWGEYDVPGYAYTQLALACGSYGSSYQLSIVEDSTTGQYCYAWYVGSTWYDELCLYTETYINSGGSINFIEATSTPGFGSATDSWTVFGDGLAYTSSTTTNHNIGSLTWSYPVSAAISLYNGSWSWSTTYWSIPTSASSPWSFYYDWSCSGGSCPT